MPGELKLERCDPTDPNRCQGVGSQGQCPFKAVPGTQMCQRHGANKQLESQDTKRLHDYHLQKWQVRIDDFSASERLTSLRGEVGILRMMLEQTLEMCDDQQQLMLYSHRIQDLTMKIDKLVNSLSKIEMKAGNLLDKSQALILASQIVELIGRHITDATTIDAISNELIDLVVKLAGKETDLDE
jgi:hypothetical protein